MKREISDIELGTEIGNRAEPPDIFVALFSFVPHTVDTAEGGVDRLIAQTDSLTRLFEKSCCFRSFL